MPATQRPIFGGARLRGLRGRRGLNQRVLAAELGISVSYLSQIESDDRPITASVLSALIRAFPDEWASVSADDDAAFTTRAARAAADPSIGHALPDDLAMRRTFGRHPAMTRRMIALHEALVQAQEQLRAMDDRLAAGQGERGLLPWEEARDWFHRRSNYVDELDRAAEDMLPVDGASDRTAAMSRLLIERFGVRIAFHAGQEPPLRTYDPGERRLYLDPTQASETTSFSIAHQLVRMQHAAVMDDILRSSRLSGEAADLVRAGLLNYAAGALLMPYEPFRLQARAVRHDIERLRRRFGTSFEQTCHRLSTLQRPGAAGVPFFFCRVDMAGNVTKRHSATRLEFARFGGGCPLWVVHEAVAIPDRVLVQFAQTPDGVRYVSMAKGLVKASSSYERPARRYAVALGCELEHAGEFIYADSIQTDAAAVPIGASCRICPRETCEQRAFPPTGAELYLDLDRRDVVPYGFK